MDLPVKHNARSANEPGSHIECVMHFETGVCLCVFVCSLNAKQYE